MTCFPFVENISENVWYLYRINIQSESDKLGFIVPSKLLDVSNADSNGCCEIV